MRDAYVEQLDELVMGLARMCEGAADALNVATRALLTVDLQAADDVTTGDLAIHELRREAESRAFALLALQAPVATDLRIVIFAIHPAADIERMGDLAQHGAQSARRRHPHPVLPDSVASYFAEMGKVGSALAPKAAVVIRIRDMALAAELEADDDAMDDPSAHVQRAVEPAVGLRGRDGCRPHLACAVL